MEKLKLEDLLRAVNDLPPTPGSVTLAQWLGREPTAEELELMRRALGLPRRGGPPRASQPAESLPTLGWAHAASLVLLALAVPLLLFAGWWVTRVFANPALTVSIVTLTFVWVLIILECVSLYVRHR